MTNWEDCRNILCIRPDNMGDLLMSGPALRALKTTFSSRITVLTSSMAAGIAAHMPEIDEVIVFDLPWIKTERAADSTALFEMIAFLRQRNFDAAVIFTVFSQNPLPTALLAYQAAIPRVLAYCRENPYGLLSDWVPDKEPYSQISHQVKRDVDLVTAIGAKVQDERLQLTVPEHFWPSVNLKLNQIGWNSNKRWLVLHPGVSEIKRQYPVEHWIAAGKLLVQKGYQLVVSGTSKENVLTTAICAGIGAGSFNAAGLFELAELLCLIKHSTLLLSVNTGPVHIAAAVGTPVVVLYAQTNPQHTPWQVPHEVLQFPVPNEMQSKNEVIRFLQEAVYAMPIEMPGPQIIVDSVERLIKQCALSDQQFR